MIAALKFHVLTGLNWGTPGPYYAAAIGLNEAGNRVGDAFQPGATAAIGLNEAGNRVGDAFQPGATAGGPGGGRDSEGQG